MDRKTFINSLVRLSLMGGLVLLTGFLAAKRSLIHQDSCSRNTFCDNCSEYTGCRKPQALKQKNNGGNK